MGIPRKQKPSPAEGEFLFQLDPEPLEECVTAYAGIPLSIGEQLPLPLAHADRESEVKYFAVGSNQWDWEAVRLLEWQREKAGTTEALHDVLKNELVAGVMPCGRFGANAAWLRLAVMTHNVLTALKRLAMPKKWLTARPKRMRFQIFCSPGKLVSHARQNWLRVRRLKEQLGEWIETLRFLA
jgi:hypothetical protein